jgi:prephenate dehydrogenase
VHASIKIIDEVLHTVNDDALVIDAGSTKEQICKSIEAHPKRRNFLAAHPIAGTEFSGPSAAISRLFEGKTNIICEVEKTAFSLQEKALELFKNLGMRIRYMDPKSHDKHIAYVSHLSHISSFMLGKTVIEKEKNERDIFDLAGSGFASTVRLAKSSPAMWAPIFEQNKTNVIETLDEYISNLQEFKNLMLQDNFEGIYKEMENTNYIKKILKGLE